MRLRALIIKEFYQIIRDPSSILICIVLPFVLLLIYGFGVSLDLNHLRIGIVMEDTSPDAQSLLKSFTDSRYYEVTIARDRRELESKLMAGRIRGYVVIPSYFSSFRKRPAQIAPIQVIADGSEPNTANFVQNYVNATWRNWLDQENISQKLQGLPLVRLQTRYWYNPELESRNFLIPGSLAIIMTLVGTLLTALVVAREWERGTMEALLATPITKLEIFFGKFIPYYVLGMFSFLASVIFAEFVYSIPFRGSYFALCLVAGAFLFAAISLGLMVSTAARNQIVASQAALVIGFMPSLMLSGFIFEIHSMPAWIQGLTYLIPARYFVSCLQTLFLVGDIWVLLLFNIALMLLFGTLLFINCIRKTSKRLD